MSENFNFCIAPTKPNVWMMTFLFRNITNFINKIGDIAEAEGHHPDISFGWGYAKIKIFTHSIKGLAESDFVLAAKIDHI